METSVDLEPFIITIKKIHSDGDDNSKTYDVPCYRHETVLSLKKRISKILELECQDDNKATFRIWSKDENDEYYEILEDNTEYVLNLYDTIINNIIEYQNIMIDSDKFLYENSIAIDTNIQVNPIIIDDYNLEEIVSETNVHLFTCSICLEVVDKMFVICTQGHSTCRQCADKIIARKGTSKCPQCRAIVTNKTISRNLFYEEILYREIVQCPFFIKQQHNKNNNNTPCNNMKYSDLDKHCKDCRYRLVNCKECNEEMMFYQVDSHIEVCSKRSFQCKSCSQIFKRDTLVDHYSIQCPLFIVSCDQCKMAIDRCDLEYHKTKYCLNSLLTCICKTQVKRSELKQHLLLYNSHMKYIVSVSDKLDQLEKENETYKLNNQSLEQKNQKLKDKNQLLKQECDGYKQHRQMNDQENQPHKPFTRSYLQRWMRNK